MKMIFLIYLFKSSCKNVILHMKHKEIFMTPCDKKKMRAKVFKRVGLFHFISIETLGHSKHWNKCIF